MGAPTCASASAPSNSTSNTPSSARCSSWRRALPPARAGASHRVLRRRRALRATWHCCRHPLRSWHSNRPGRCSTPASRRQASAVRIAATREHPFRQFLIASSDRPSPPGRHRERRGRTSEWSSGRPRVLTVRFGVESQGPGVGQKRSFANSKDLSRRKAGASDCRPSRPAIPSAQSRRSPSFPSSRTPPRRGASGGCDQARGRAGSERRPSKSSACRARTRRVPVA